MCAIHPTLQSTSVADNHFHFTCTLNTYKKIYDAGLSPKIKCIDLYKRNSSKSVVTHQKSKALCLYLASAFPFHFGVFLDIGGLSVPRERARDPRRRYELQQRRFQRQTRCQTNCQCSETPSRKSLRKDPRRAPLVSLMWRQRIKLSLTGSPVLSTTRAARRALCAASRLFPHKRSSIQCSGGLNSARRTNKAGAW